MELEIRRLSGDPASTEGDLYIVGSSTRECCTLERPMHGDGPLAIPAGRYELVPYFSPHFNRIVPLFVGVPGRTDIEMHPANFVRELKGCVAVGRDQTSLHDGIIEHSVAAFDALIAKMQHVWNQHEKVFATVINPN